MAEPIYPNVPKWNNRPQKLGGTLPTGGGGGTFDPMEARVATLETLMKVTREDLAAIKTDVGTLKTDVAILKERVSHLPTKGFIVTTTTLALGLITALFMFQAKLQAVVGLTH